MLWHSWRSVDSSRWRQPWQWMDIQTGQCTSERQPTCHWHNGDSSYRFLLMRVCYTNAPRWADNCFAQGEIFPEKVTTHHGLYGTLQTRQSQLVLPMMSHFEYRPYWRRLGQNRKYKTYCSVVTEGPSHCHHSVNTYRKFVKFGLEVFGRPFVKRFAPCSRTIVCVSVCLSVCVL